jgi:excisionase family DNA binding protein
MKFTKALEEVAENSMTVAETADALKISIDGVYKAINKGRLKSYELHGQKIIHVDDFRNYLKLYARKARG